MTSDAKAVLRRIYEDVIGRGQLDLLDEIIHDDFVEHEEIPDMPRDKGGPRAFMSMLRAGFPDVSVTMEDAAQEGDTVFVRARMRGTHKGEFIGIPATGKSVEVAMWDAVRFADDGRIIEHWGLVDSMTMMQQLGVVPDNAPG